MTAKMDFNISNLTTGWTLTIILTTGFAYLLITSLNDYLSPTSKFLRSLPSATHPQPSQQKWLPSTFQTALSTLHHTREILTHTTSLLPSTPYTLPQLFSPPILLLPPSHLRPLLAKPDTSVDVQRTLAEVTAAKYTGDWDIIVDKPLHLDVVKHQLTRKVPLFTEAVAKELEEGMEGEWGEGNKRVKVWGSCMGIVSRGANRIFSGVELCRNEEFLAATREYTSGIFYLAGITNLFPKILRPVVGRWLSWRNDRHLNVAKKHAIPVIEKRLQDYRMEKKSSENVALDWIIEEAITTNDPKEIDPIVICRRLVRLNMVAIHTTSMTITNTILDLYTSLRKEEFIRELREEIEKVLERSGGKWTKTAVNELVKVDSTIKESMRLSTFLTMGITRLVQGREGIDLDENTHIPPGVKISFPIGTIHRDPANYEHPDGFDAFRFAQNREDLDTLEQRRQGVVSTSETFLGFGCGRHACPGRFFAAQEMKLLLAHIILHYDVEVPGARPNGVVLGGTTLPDPRAEILVRKRVVGEEDGKGRRDSVQV